MKPAPEVVFILGFSSSILTDGYHFTCTAQQKLCIFQQVIMQVVFHFDFLRWSSLIMLMSTTLSAALSKSYAFSTKYHICIAMPTWCTCAPHILFWPWPPFNLFPSSCKTWIFFSDPQWGVSLCVQRPTNSMPFQQIVMYIIIWLRYKFTGAGNCKLWRNL